MLAEGQRRSALAAMGVDVYVLRTRVAPDAVAHEANAPPTGDVDLIVACADADHATARLRALLPHALGIAASRIGWVDPAHGVPAAPAYLALGADMPRSLGAHLSTMQQSTLTIAVADAASAALASGLAKHALWQALKPLARRLQQQG